MLPEEPEVSVCPPPLLEGELPSLPDDDPLELLEPDEVDPPLLPVSPPEPEPLPEPLEPDEPELEPLLLVGSLPVAVDVCVEPPVDGLS